MDRLINYVIEIVGLGKSEWHEKCYSNQSLASL